MYVSFINKWSQLMQNNHRSNDWIEGALESLKLWGKPEYTFMCYTVLFNKQAERLGYVHAFCCLFVCSLKLNTENVSNPQLHSVKLSSHVEDTLRHNWWHRNKRRW